MLSHHSCLTDVVTFVLAVFPAIFITFGPALQYAVVEYTASGHSHTLVRVCTNTADVVARVRCASAEIECSCTASSRCSARGMCSMNT